MNIMKINILKNKEGKKIKMIIAMIIIMNIIEKNMLKKKEEKEIKMKIVTKIIMNIAKINNKETPPTT